MRRTMTGFTIVMIIIGGLYGTSFSEDSHTGHQGHGHGNEMTPPPAMDHSGHMGEMIREGRVEGYGFMYHLITLPEQAKGAKEMEDTHHLMVYLSTPDGKPVDAGTVGFLVKAPDGKTQQKMTMAMGGGFGADISLKGKGSFAIKTKAVLKARTLVDEFTHKVE